jgi:phosphohistidine phosphatase
MDLYLIRHAEAEQLGNNGITEDADRPLTATGQEQAKALGAGLQEHGVQLQTLVTSPLVRAQQTADGILQHWPQPVPELCVCDDLAPSSRRKKLARFLLKLDATSVGIVGHMPDLGEFGGWLLGSKDLILDLEKAGVALIRCEHGVGKGGGSLVWMVTPEWYSSKAEAKSPRPTRSANGG